MDTKKRVALVSGGGGGLCEAICLKLAALGYEVVTTYSSSNTHAEQWLRDMREKGYAFHAFPCDVSDLDSCVACVKNVTDAVGPVDILVNNAGATLDMTFRKMDKVNWAAVMHTNLDSCFNMTTQVCDGIADRVWLASSTSPLSTVGRAPLARPTTRRPKPACTALPRHSRSRSPARV
jgi:acetoacetyl-CoA reductase